MCILDTEDLYVECKKIGELPKNTSRRNVSGIDIPWLQKHGYNTSGHKLADLSRRIIPRGLPCESITFGQQRVFLQKRCVPCKANAEFPYVYMELKNLAEKAFPEFKYNCITLNHNLQCLPHRDSINNVRQSHSIILGFGDYTGGDLNIEGCDFNIKNNPLIFNGQRSTHATMDYEGDRWSVIYYYKYYPTHYAGYTDTLH